jgi:hypothetical protein
LVALAGEQYRTALRDVPWPVEIPMKGLGIGRQLGWLTAQLGGRLSDGKAKIDAWLEQKQVDDSSASARAPARTFYWGTP